MRRAAYMQQVMKNEEQKWQQAMTQVKSERDMVVKKCEQQVAQMREQSREATEAMQRAQLSEAKIGKEMGALEEQREFEIQTFNQNIDELNAQIEGLHQQVA